MRIAVAADHAGSALEVQVARSVDGAGHPLTAGTFDIDAQEPRRAAARG